MNLNIAARAGRWSAGHWKAAVWTWFGFCVVAIAVGSAVGTKMLKQSDTAAGGTRTAEQILQRAGFPDQASESVLVQSKSATTSAAGFRATVDDVVRSVSALADPLGVTLPAVAQHLQILEAAGLVRTEKLGRVRTAQIDARGLDRLDRWTRERRSVWERRIDQLAQMLGNDEG